MYDGKINVRGHYSCILHDKVMVFGGVRDKKDKEVLIETKISRKLFFICVLQIKDDVTEGISFSKSSPSSMSRVAKKVKKGKKIK